MTFSHSETENQDDLKSDLIYDCPSFSDLGLNLDLCHHLKSIDFTKPTPIQQKAISPFLMGQDVIACAQTGSGKTGSFLLPLIQILSESPVKARMPKAIILEPTRELAQQVFEQFSRFCHDKIPLKAALLVGGESMLAQEKILLSNPDVLIVTPGRLLDFCDREKIILFGVRYVIIDEADRLLDMGFLPDVKRILEKAPPSRQTLLFSATFAPEIQELTNLFMLAPKILSIETQGKTVDTIEQFAVKVSDEKSKKKAVYALLQDIQKKSDDHQRVIIFCNKKISVQDLATYLSKKDILVEPLHGDLLQTVRNQTIDRFKNVDFQVLVASDIVARGLDIEDLPYVINYDLPIQTEDYVHRIGRTGRAGKTGHAFSFVTPKEHKKWKQIQSLIQKEVIDYALTIFEDIDTSDEALKIKKDKSSKYQKPHKVKDSLAFEKKENVAFYGFGEDAPEFFLKDTYKKSLNFNLKI